MKTERILSWLVALLGLWEVVAPFILGYTFATAGLWDAIIIGIALIVLAIWAAVSNVTTTVRTLEWINTALGVWLVIAPFALGYASVTAAMWNDIVIGVIVAVLSVWAALTVGHSAGRPTGHAV